MGQRLDLGGWRPGPCGGRLGASEGRVLAGFPGPLSSLSSSFSLAAASFGLLLAGFDWFWRWASSSVYFVWLFSLGWLVAAAARRPSSGRWSFLLAAPLGYL
jgi:hypothetical protein